MAAHTQSSILSGLPMALIGVVIVVIALLFMVWPPDFEGSFPTDNVSHWARLMGEDSPSERPVVRTDYYAVRRGVDALAYYMVFQSLVAIGGLALFADRHMYILLIISGLFGVVYAGALGLVIGPMIAAVGYAFILLSGILGWYSNKGSEIKRSTYPINREVASQVVREDR